MSRDIAYRGWHSGPQLDLGDHDGTAVRDGALVMVAPGGKVSYRDPHAGGGPVDYETASWVSPTFAPGFAATALVPSWNARTPAGTWIEVAVAAMRSDGSCAGEWVVARWAETHEDILPTSLPAQRDEHVEVTVDELTARGETTFSAFRMRVTLLRRAGTEATPSVTLVGAVASGVTATATATATNDTVNDTGDEPSGPARGVVLDVPTYSQQLHRGEYPQWGAGGEAWCSPTATSMVLAHFDRGPAPEEYAWVDAGHVDRFVDHAAKHVFDHEYGGGGNWTFNTAYAGRYGLVAYVTRLRSLLEAEQLVAAGVPLVVSLSFVDGELEGAGYGTAGHLLTIVGFDEAGDVVVNDPASHEIPDNDQVRTTYRRDQFERAWLAPSGGLAYVMHPPGHPLPEPPAQPNWASTASAAASPERTAPSM